MDFENFKDYFSTPNLVMIGGAVGGFAVGTMVGQFVAGKIGGSDFQRALITMLSGFAVGGVLYMLGRDMEPGSTWKPAMYGLAIGAALPGIMNFISTLLGGHPTAGPIIRPLFGAGMSEGNVKVETV